MRFGAAGRTTRRRRGTIERLESRLVLAAAEVLADGEMPGFQADALPLPTSAQAAASGSAAMGGGALISLGSKHPLTALPARNSLPGATAALYLDFDGNLDAQWGTDANITTPVFDRDGDPTTFDDGELTVIDQIWRYVAEDFAPFRLNVTTVPPPGFQNGAALRVAIGGDGAWLGATYGGIAYVDSFTNSIVNTVYVFPKNLANGDPKFTAQAVSHEAGHGFGLEHQSSYDAAGKLLNEYQQGTSDGQAPIMGEGYRATRGVWWKGPSAAIGGAVQDDISVIARSRNGFGLRDDDYGDSPQTAQPLPRGQQDVSASGLIGAINDRDYFSFTTAATTAALSAQTAGVYANLDIRLELWDATGAQLLAVADPADALDASITTPLAAGTYTLVVASHGSYGDLGQYTLHANIKPPPAVPVAPLPAPTPITGTSPSNHPITPVSEAPTPPSTSLVPLAAPIQLRTTIVASYQVMLVWNDRTNNERGFLIERSANRGRSWSEAGTVEADVHQFADHSVEPATTYWYRVRAFNAAGSSPVARILTVQTASLTSAPMAGPAASPPYTAEPSAVAAVPPFLPHPTNLPTVTCREPATLLRPAVQAIPWAVLATPLVRKQLGPAPEDENLDPVSTIDGSV